MNSALVATLKNTQLRVLRSALTGGDRYGRGSFGVIFMFLFNLRGQRWC